jgi:hypothetical protein
MVLFRDGHHRGSNIVQSCDHRDACLQVQARPILTVKSVPLRIAFFFISVAIFALLMWMMKHQMAAAMQYFDQPS